MACTTAKAADMWVLVGDEDGYPVYAPVCPTHGLTEIVDEQAFTGFAGGDCYVWVLACDCTTVDESADVAAAR